MGLWRLSPHRSGNGYRCGGGAAAWHANRAGDGGESVPPAPWGDLLRVAIATRAGHGAPACGGAAAEAAPGRGPFRRARQAGQGGAGATASPISRPRPRRAAAFGLPAGADRCHRDRAQHPRHQGRRRLRGRGSGAAGGDRAAGQAAGFGQAGGDPALSHGVCAGRLDPQRYRAAGGAPRQRRLRSRQFRLVRVPRPQPRRRRQAFRARPRQCARRSRLQVRQRHARSR